MDRRGFAGVEEMNAYMLQRWNEKVRKNDEVVILGDLSWGNAEQTNRLLGQLKGKLYLIQGNHDRFHRNKELDAGRFQWIRPYEELSDHKRKVILCHYPILFYNGQYRLDEKGNPKTYMLYGHVHDSRDQRLLEEFQRRIRETVTTDMEGNRRNIPCDLDKIIVTNPAGPIPVSIEVCTFQICHAIQKTERIQVICRRIPDGIKSQTLYPCKGRERIRTIHITIMNRQVLYSRQAPQGRD